MQLFVVGTSHRTAGVDVRERLAVGPASIEPLLGRLRDAGAREALVLSTCNRIEVYGFGEEDTPNRVMGALGWPDVLPDAELAAHVYVHGGVDAARHLFRVAAGLDSMVLGESQILGQVKAAAALAERAHTLGGTLRRVLERAFGAAKRVRSQTAIGEAPVSVSSVAVELVQHVFEDVAERSVLLVGASATGRLAAQSFRARGCSRLVVCSRTAASARALTTEVGGQAWPWERRGEALDTADVVVCATSAPDAVIDESMVRAAMKRRKQRPLLFLDLAVPRDVAVGAALLPNVFVYDLDAIGRVVERHRGQRAREAERAELIVDEELARLGRALERRPTLQRLRQRADEIAADEIDRTLARLPELDEAGRRSVTAMARAIVNKLLHEPSVRLRQADDAEALAQAVDRLFDLGHDESRPQGRQVVGP